MYKSLEILKLILLTKYFEPHRSSKENCTSQDVKDTRFYKCVTSRKAKGKLGIAKGNQKDIDNTNNGIYRGEAYF